MMALLRGFGVERITQTLAKNAQVCIHNRKAPKKGSTLEIFSIPIKPRCYADCGGGGDVDEYIYEYGALKGTLKVRWNGQQKIGAKYLVHFFGLRISQKFSTLDPKEVMLLLERALKEAAFDLDQALQLNSL